MVRWLIAGLLVVGLAIGVWMVWPDEEPSSSSNTTIAAVDTSTSSAPADSSTTTTEPTSTTTSADVVTTAEEAEEILAALWFGWFEGIYNQDEARIREVVGSQGMLDSARAAFDGLTFVAAPSTGAIEFQNIELLHSTDQCLVVWTQSTAPFLSGDGVPREGVDVLRWTGGSWRFVSSWVHRDDLWEADCNAVLVPLS